MKSILALLVFGKLIFFFWPRLGVEPRTCWIFAFLFASLWSYWRYLLPCYFTLKLEFSLQRPKKLEFELGWWNLSWKEVAGSKIPCPCSDCRKSSHDKPKALMSKFFRVLLVYRLAIGLSYKSYTMVVWNRKLSLRSMFSLSFLLLVRVPPRTSLKRLPSLLSRRLLWRTLWPQSEKQETAFFMRLLVGLMDADRVTVASWNLLEPNENYFFL